MKPVVLIVTKEAGRRQLVAALFDAAGCAVECAADVSDAVNRFAASEADIVLLDAKLPEIARAALVQVLHGRIPRPRLVLLGSEESCNSFPVANAEALFPVDNAVLIGALAKH